MSPTSIHAGAPPLGLQPTNGVISNVTKMGVVSVCALILYAAEVIPAMLSEKANRSFLFFSMTLFVIFGAMWMYTAVHLSKRNLKWFEENEKFLHAATIIGILGGLSWIIGMWPVFHVFALPLWLVIVVLVVNLNGISFKSKKLSSKVL